MFADLMLDHPTLRYESTGAELDADIVSSPGKTVVRSPSGTTQVTVTVTEPPWRYSAVSVDTTGFGQAWESELSIRMTASPDALPA
jgi:hypothetical protein